MKKEIVIITASTVKNLELALKFQESLNSMEANATIINLVDLDLPLYTSKSEGQHKAMDLLKDELPFIEKAAAFVFLSPEYNGSTPPVLTNFLAWLSRTSKDWRQHLNGKHVAIGTFSSGTGLNVLQTMRTQLSFMGMNVLGRQIVTTSAKALDEKSLLAVCTELLKFA